MTQSSKRSMVLQYITIKERYKVQDLIHFLNKNFQGFHGVAKSFTNDSGEEVKYLELNIKVKNGDKIRLFPVKLTAESKSILRFLAGEAETADIKSQFQDGFEK